MKKILFSMLLLIMGFTACKKEDNPFHISKNPTEINSMDKNNLSPSIVAFSETIKLAGGTADTSFTEKEIFVLGMYKNYSYTFKINKSELNRYNLYFSYKSKVEELRTKEVNSTELGKALTSTKFE